MKKHLLFSLLLTLAAFLNQAAWSQGVTTSSLSGYVKDANGEGLPMANIVAVHTPTGTQYGLPTQIDGNFTINNMKIGGPYTVTASFVGYEDQTVKGVFLKLGEAEYIEFVLTDGSVQLADVVVTGSQDETMNADRTGAATTVGREQLTALPTISRSAQDFTRLTPQSDGNSFGGRNKLFNNFSLDGSIFNNSFGLDYATPGGQTGSQPVSLDAIDQIQVSIAPFDVRQGGFTGAGVNAVTKSGTNEFTGTAYSFGRNESMVGSKVAGDEIPNLNFFTNQSGFSVGGPILKNKLFFFVNGEIETQEELAHGWVADDGQEGANVTSINYDDITDVRNHLKEQFGYETGDFQGYNHDKFNRKMLAKIDWNINNDHQLSLRYNNLHSYRDILPHPEAIGGRAPNKNRLTFANSSYRIFNNINSIVGDLKSRFGNNISNKLLVSYTAFRDEREPASEPFVTFDIWNNYGGVPYITGGSEMFSTYNLLNQDVFQVTNDLTFFMGKHTITAGVNYEQFKFRNDFNLFHYPWVVYGSVNDFLNNSPLFAVGTNPGEDISDLRALTDARADKEPISTNINFAQAALYVQDEYQANDRLKLTLGLRVDRPFYLSSVVEDENIKSFDGWKDENGNSVDLDPSKFPTPSLLWSPRFGFNWDAMGDRSLQVRGGSGIFTGRIPFVWLSNQAANATVYPGAYYIGATTDDFKFPQVWKTNVAIDKTFGKGWTATLEGIYSKDLNAVVYRNYNMDLPSLNAEGADERPIFTPEEANIYNNSGDVVGDLGAGAIVMDNTNEGYQYSITAQLKKAFDFGLTASASYTYLDARDKTSIPAEIAGDAIQRIPVVGSPNDVQLSYSRYGMKHRIVSTLGYKVSYGKMATTISLFAEAGQGGRFSYTYAGDMNGDSYLGNDLIYVPADASEIQLVDYTNDAGDVVTAEEQWTALNEFIENDPYLSAKRGEYTERYGALSPWFSQFDIRILQDYNFKVAGRTNTVQLSFDILNVGNLVNSDWGVRQIPTNVNPIVFEGYQAGSTADQVVPEYTFRGVDKSFSNNVSLLSKWQAQVGLRYIF